MTDTCLREEWGYIWTCDNDGVIPAFLHPAEQSLAAANAQDAAVNMQLGDSRGLG
jgi:hypothetical protein